MIERGPGHRVVSGVLVVVEGDPGPAAIKPDATVSESRRARAWPEYARTRPVVASQTVTSRALGSIVRFVRAAAAIRPPSRLEAT